MRIMANGIDYSTGESLIAPMEVEALSQRLEQALQQNIDEVRELAGSTRQGMIFRDEIESLPTPNLADPRTAGWRFLVNENDPHYEAMVEAIRPLAEHRGMAEPGRPFLYRGETVDDWFDWMTENYSPLALGAQVPFYVLIVGGPDQVPFAFQSMLASAAAVGRLDFDTVDDLHVYVEKVLRLEQAEQPAARRGAVFFAPDYGLDDATFFSRKYMAEPLAEHVQEARGFPTVSLMGEEATKDGLAQALSGTRPALVFTASHGVGARSHPLATQKQVNGAICCRREEQAEWIYTAGDVPTGEPFLEGAVFFQFACFGYGTPAESDYNHWLNEPTLNAEEDFVAALPRRLITLPRGPVAYIGHLDTAFLHGFDDPESPYALERWDLRIAPFVRALDELLGAHPPGLAMRDMGKRYDLTNAQLTSTYDRAQRGRLRFTPAVRRRFVDLFITRSDAQNYMIYGDPGVQVRILDETEGG